MHNRLGTEWLTLTQKRMKCLHTDFLSPVDAGQLDIMTMNYAEQFPACDLSWNSYSHCEWQPRDVRSRWIQRCSCPCTEPSTCILLIKGLCPRSWSFLQSTDLLVPDHAWKQIHRLARKQLQLIKKTVWGGHRMNSSAIGWPQFLPQSLRIMSGVEVAH